MKTNNSEFFPTASLETLLTPEATALLSEIKNDIMAGIEVGRFSRTLVIESYE